jgi:Dolichyl-phosphate-mannose-protein mannosyltransferase
VTTSQSTTIRGARFYLPALVCVFVVLCLAYNAALPLFEAPDEGAHYIYVDYIAQNHALPSMVDLPSHEVSQPPLYYLLAAPLISWIDRSDFAVMYRPNPGLANGIVNDHLPQELAFPPTGVTLAIRILRLFSTLLGAVTILLVYLTVKTIFRRDDVALVALAVTAFNPKFLHMSSQFNNDIAVACAGALCLWVAARLMLQAKAPSTRQLLVLGATAGIATATKYSGMALVVSAAFAVTWCVLKLDRRRWRSLLATFAPWGALCTAGFGLTSGWLFLYNTLRYGSPLAATQFEHAHALGIRPVPLSAMEILDRVPKLFTSYWGEFGHGVQFPFTVDTVMWLVVAIIFIGVIVAAVRRQLPRELLLLVVTFLVTEAAFILWMRNQTGTENSRLISPAFAAISAYAAAGLLAWFPLRFRRSGAVGITVMSVCGGAVGLFLSLVPGYAMPAYLSSAQAAILPTQGAVKFDNGIELVSASIDRNRLQSGQELGVSVYWSATQPITDVYRVAVELRDDHDQVMGRMSTLPLAGRYATTQMLPGKVFRDDYRVRVEPANQAQIQRSMLRVYIGLYQHRSPFNVSHVLGSGAASAQIGLVKLQGAQPTYIAPTQPFSSTFGSLIGLEGYAVTTDTLTLYWRDLKTPPQDYTVFVHVLDASRQQIAQADAPVGYPLPYWDPGEQVIDVRRIAGIYKAASIQIGLYDPNTSQRLPAFHIDQSPWTDNSVVLPVLH